MVTCEPDLYESSIFIVCKDGTWNETMPDCTETGMGSKLNGYTPMCFW